MKQTVSTNHPDRGGNELVVEAVVMAVAYLIETRGAPNRYDYRNDAGYERDWQRWKDAQPKCMWYEDPDFSAPRFKKINLESHEKEMEMIEKNARMKSDVFQSWWKEMYNNVVSSSNEDPFIENTQFSRKVLRTELIQLYANEYNLTIAEAEKKLKNETSVLKLGPTVQEVIQKYTSKATKTDEEK